MLLILHEISPDPQTCLQLQNVSLPIRSTSRSYCAWNVVSQFAAMLDAESPPGQLAKASSRIDTHCSKNCRLTDHENSTRFTILIFQYLVSMYDFGFHAEESRLWEVLLRLECSVWRSAERLQWTYQVFKPHLRGYSLRSTWSTTYSWALCCELDIVQMAFAGLCGCKIMSNLRNIIFESMWHLKNQP